MKEEQSQKMKQIEPKLEEIMNDFNEVLKKHNIVGVKIDGFTYDSETSESNEKLKCYWGCKPKGTGVFCGIICEF